MNHFCAGITVICLRQYSMIDISDDYYLGGVMTGGREERKGHNNANDNYRTVNI